jgi:cyclohexanone monooxygenase
MQHNVDAIVVGAGFGGIYMCKKLVDQGLSVKVIEAASDVGGTWYWNRYPGAMSELVEPIPPQCPWLMNNSTGSHLYRYSWDLDDLRQYPWKRTYVRQPEVLAYLQHVVERHRLRQYMQFDTEVISADWDNSCNLWLVRTNTGQELGAKYLVTAVGLLSRQNFPKYPGIDLFKGELYHTGSWPKEYDFKGKRVGVLGSGSTGVQVITTLASEVKQLLCFQRTPQYVVPAGDIVATPEYRKDINDSYEEIWKQAKDSAFAFGFEESTKPAMSVSSEERERIFEEAWQQGNGFRFMFGTFCDISYDEDANHEAANFIKKKIRAIVKDPVKASKLIPTDYYARRPLCDTGYYEKFNRDNVDIVDIKETPITHFTERGVITSDGTEHELDVVIFATGFDAVDGNYTRIPIRGRKGETLKERWAEGPSSYLGVSVSDYPNLFMILGPNGPFTNLPPSIEAQVEFISGLISHANTNTQGLVLANGARGPAVEATAEAEKEWSDVCDKLSANSLFRKTDSWIFGANVPGKRHSVLFYFGGLGRYRSVLDGVIEAGYKGFLGC